MAAKFRVERHLRRVGINVDEAVFETFLPPEFDSHKLARSFIVSHIQSYAHHGFNEERGYWWGRSRDGDFAHVFTVRWPES